MNILHVAAENGSLPGGKVGGIGDVIRDLPMALTSLGCRITVITPSHGFLHLQAGAEKIGSCRFSFRGDRQGADIYSVRPLSDDAKGANLVIDHPGLSTSAGEGGKSRLYVHDPPDRPFFTDGSRFALFGAAVAGAISSGLVGPLDVIHLHDWHAALVALLGRFHPEAEDVGRLRCVFTIHNLAFQGIRPLRGSDSSLEAWFPHLPYDWETVADPRWPDCINLMATGIRLADRVHTVSPTYAKEIQQPSRKPRFYGGEGLEGDLQRVHREGRLMGILNGCTYPHEPSVERLPYDGLMDLVRKEALRWSAGAETVPTAHFVAFARSLHPCGRHAEPDVTLTTVGRVGEQKMLLLMHPGRSGRSGLHCILEGIGKKGRYLLLGSGDPRYERFFTDAAARSDRFIFINGYSEKCARALYTSGDLFLMPSSYEPCGLSQLLSMREGQPCVVHSVGGLKDTVIHGRNGFAFTGDTLESQVDGFVNATLNAVAMSRGDPAAWQRVQDAAIAARFTWETAAERYVQSLYA